MTDAVRRAYLPALLALAIASGLILLGAGMPWVTGEVEFLAGTRSAQQAAWSGDQVAPLIRATGLVGLAGIAGIVATAGRGRVVVGLLLVAAGLAGAWATLAGLASLPEPPSGALGASTTAWPWIMAGCGIAIAAIGVVACLIGRRWPGLGKRYQRESSPAGSSPAGPSPAASSPWDALDHGKDPTA